MRFREGISSVGGLRRELSALTDDAEVEVTVSDVHGAPVDVVGAEALAHAYAGDGWAGIAVTVDAGEPRPLPADPFEEAWAKAERAGECPWALLSALLGRMLCATSSNCRAWQCGAACGAGWPEAYGVPAKGGGRRVQA